LIQTDNRPPFFNIRGIYHKLKKGKVKPKDGQNRYSPARRTNSQSNENERKRKTRKHKIDKSKKTQDKKETRITPIPVQLPRRQ
jgi:hypothetical protein